MSLEDKIKEKLYEPIKEKLKEEAKTLGTYMGIGGGVGLGFYVASFVIFPLQLIPIGPVNGAILGAVYYGGKKAYNITKAVSKIPGISITERVTKWYNRMADEEKNKQEYESTKKENQLEEDYQKFKQEWQNQKK